MSKGKDKAKIILGVVFVIVAIANIVRVFWKGDYIVANLEMALICGLMSFFLFRT